MSKWGELSPATIIQIAWEAKDGEADPDDARRLLIHFCEHVDGKRHVPVELLTHLRDAFASYLVGEKTLERALGIKRRRGAPNQEMNQQKMATEVLRLRLEGRTLEEAAAIVAEGYSKGEDGTVVRDAWAKNKQNAFILLRIIRSFDKDKDPWTKDDVVRLNQIFKGEEWWTPGK